MIRRFLKMSTAAAFGVLFVTQAHAATITGVINFEGTPPNLPDIKMDADPKCVANNTGPVKPAMLVLGTGNTVANVFVRIKSGLPAGKAYPAPTTPVVIDQKGCTYHPHVVGVMKDQPVKVLNSDGTLHNIHGKPTKNPEFNVAMPAFRKEMEQKFAIIEDGIPVKCDVHPWMNGYIFVQDNPFFAVTADDGKFTLANVDPGTYEIEIWQEKLGVQTAKVTVAAAGDTVTQNFTLKAPAAQ
jgi:hypothetical protein